MGKLANPLFLPHRNLRKVEPSGRLSELHCWAWVWSGLVCCVVAGCRYLVHAVSAVTSQDATNANPSRPPAHGSYPPNSHNSYCHRYICRARARSTTKAPVVVGNVHGWVRGSTQHHPGRACRFALHAARRLQCGGGGTHTHQAVRFRQLRSAY